MRVSAEVAPAARQLSALPREVARVWDSLIELCETRLHVATYSPYYYCPTTMSSQPFLWLGSRQSPDIAWPAARPWPSNFNGASSRCLACPTKPSRRSCMRRRWTTRNLWRSLHVCALVPPSRYAHQPVINPKHCRPCSGAAVAYLCQGHNRVLDGWLRRPSETEPGRNSVPRVGSTFGDEHGAICGGTSVATPTSRDR